MLTYLHTIAFTHRKFDLTKIGMLHIELNEQATRLKSVKAALELDEFLFLSTCNRVEISFIRKKTVNSAFFSKLLKALYPNLTAAELEGFVANLEHYHNRVAIQHALAVASSIDSMIIGEREIITQVRNAYEHCSANGLTGDSMRILMKHVIETAKKVYTQTSIATKPVSVVSLAYQQLKKLNIALPNHAHPEPTARSSVSMGASPMCSKSIGSPVVKTWSKRSCVKCPCTTINYPRRCARKNPQ